MTRAKPPPPGYPINVRWSWPFRVHLRKQGAHFNQKARTWTHPDEARANALTQELSAILAGGVTVHADAGFKGGVAKGGYWLQGPAPVVRVIEQVPEFPCKDSTSAEVAVLAKALGHALELWPECRFLWIRSDCLHALRMVEAHGGNDRALRAVLGVFHKRGGLFQTKHEGQGNPGGPATCAPRNLTQGG